MLHVADNAWLNIDAGETDGEPDELYAIAHAVSVACGGHAGDAASMRRVLTACVRHRTRAGAHPSYVDRDGFGRRPMTIEPSVIEEIVHAQCASLAVVAREVGIGVTHAKAHGALYHAASVDAAVARAVVAGAARALGDRAVIIGPSGSALATAARDAGLTFAREGFADRGVRADGSLVARGDPGALVTDPAVAADRARDLATSDAVDTICVHGDTPNAVAIARAVRAALDDLSVARTRA